MTDVNDALEGRDPDEILTPKEIEQLRRKAQAKTIASRKMKREDELLKQFEQEERALSDPKEERVEIFIDLPGYAKDLKINGVAYNHGEIWVVARSLYDCIRDIMFQAWKHEHAFKEPNRGQYIQPHQPFGSFVALNGPGAVIPGAQRNQFVRG